MHLLLEWLLEMRSVSGVMLMVNTGFNPPKRPSTPEWRNKIRSYERTNKKADEPPIAK